MSDLGGGGRISWFPAKIFLASTTEPYSLFLHTVKEMQGVWRLEEKKSKAKKKKKSRLLCVLISPDACYMLQQRAGALKPSPEIRLDLTTPPVNSVAQKSIVLWDNCGAEWGRLSRGGLLGQSPSDHSRGLNSFMVHQGLLVPQKVSWSFFSLGPDGVLFWGLPNARFSTCKTPGKMT